MIPALITNLRYLTVMNEAASGGSANVLIGYIDDVLFYDGVDVSAKANPAII